jgi:hypothetical protein
LVRILLRFFLFNCVSTVVRRKSYYSHPCHSRNPCFVSRRRDADSEILNRTGIATVAGGVLVSNVGQVGMGLAGTSYGRILGLGSK